MSHFGLRINKSEAPNKEPYTLFFPHTISHTERNWNQQYYQVISIDPARKNYALRIERRYHNGQIIPIVFDKVCIKSVINEGGVTIENTYQMLTYFLDKYEKFYYDCHFLIVERQLPQNYKVALVAQHTISYFSIKLHNSTLLPCLVEIDPKLKGKYLGAPKGINEKQLKTWAVEKGREILVARNDLFSLSVLDYFKNKQDDLCDVVLQTEALFICWGLQKENKPIMTLSMTPNNNTNTKIIKLNIHDKK